MDKEFLKWLDNRLGEAIKARVEANTLWDKGFRSGQIRAFSEVLATLKKNQKEAME